ncbi:MAG: hypothetical protein K2Q18_14440 [Bdellovibrionales bacterium]|nr:hypothetical protein [Bdellovibrionales bacterium]
MKTLCLVIFSVFMAIAQALDSSQKPLNGLEKKSPKVLKSARAYREAKVECIKKSMELKGSKLTNCIVEYQKKSK